MKKSRGAGAHGKRAQRQRAGVPAFEISVEPFDMGALARRLDTLGPLGPLGRRATGVDTCEGVSDDDIAIALMEEPILLRAAERLSEALGRGIARCDLADRIQTSQRLQDLHRAAELARDRRLFAQCEEVVAQAHQLRDHGPPCGAKTRSGRPCRRRPALGRSRCPNHGGASTGPRTPEGMARSAEGRRQRWAAAGSQRRRSVTGRATRP